MGVAEVTDAYEVIAGHEDARMVLTCEHASQRMPEAFTWPEADHRLIDTHWAYDIGAELLARELAVRMNAPLVVSRFTRLLIDPNRPLDSETLFRAEAEGHKVWLNRDITTEARRQRIEDFYNPYHDAVDRVIRSYPRASTIFSIHTFTDVFEGTQRSLEVGVLYGRNDALAERLSEGLSHAGFKTARNEPYSGYEGLTFSVDQHGIATNRASLELEVRQDLVVNAQFRTQLIDALDRLFADR